MKILQGIGMVDKNSLLKLKHHIWIRDLEKVEEYLDQITSWQFIFNSNIIKVYIYYKKYGCTCGCDKYYPEKCTNGKMRRLETHYKWFIFEARNTKYYIKTKKQLSKWCKLNKGKYDFNDIKNKIRKIEKVNEIQYIVAIYKRLSILIIDIFGKERWIRINLKLL